MLRQSNSTALTTPPSFDQRAQELLKSLRSADLSGALKLIGNFSSLNGSDLQKDQPLLYPTYQKISATIGKEKQEIRLKSLHNLISKKMNDRFRHYKNEWIKSLGPAKIDEIFKRLAELVNNKSDELNIQYIVRDQYTMRKLDKLLTTENRSKMLLEMIDDIYHKELTFGFRPKSKNTQYAELDARCLEDQNRLEILNHFRGDATQVTADPRKTPNLRVPNPYNNKNYNFDTARPYYDIEAYSLGKPKPYHGNRAFDFVVPKPYRHNEAFELQGQCKGQPVRQATYLKAP